MLDSDGSSRDADEQVVTGTRRWIERAVIGLNLCPFAKLPFGRGAIGYAVSAARDTVQLRNDLRDALRLLVAADPLEFETSLLIHPHVLGDFLDYNDFLDEADAVLVELELDGTIQIASFHPDYQFADAAPTAIENATNRSPYPTLHLLRESSIERAVKGPINVDEIPPTNTKTLRKLGRVGWDALWENT
ncbi:MAG: DUF1415 domain-containing protein [Dokdonella sp.]